jgi:hypothetical protein
MYQWLKAWFLELYEDPLENCPYESAEGGYQYIWGGPYDALEELRNAWGDVFLEAFLEKAAERLCDEFACFEWSRVPTIDCGEEEC